MELVYVHDQSNVNEMAGPAIILQKREMISIVKIVTESFVMVIIILLKNTCTYMRSLFF